MTTAERDIPMTPRWFGHVERDPGPAWSQRDAVLVLLGGLGIVGAALVALARLLWR